MSSLFIIGNGFEIAHKIPSTYMYDFTQDLIEIVESCWPCLFNLWIYSLQNEIYLGKISIKPQLLKILQNSDTKIFTFNYTTTIEDVYLNNNVIHIHNKFEEPLLVGHGENEEFYIPKLMDDGREAPSFSSSDLEDMIMRFKKDTDNQMKIYEEFFNGLNFDINNVYSYRFSYSKW